MDKQTPIAVFWFRRDLRLNDNAGLYHALKSGKPVLPIFIFDKSILSKLTFKDDARLSLCIETGFGRRCSELRHGFVAGQIGDIGRHRSNPIDIDDMENAVAKLYGDDAVTQHQRRDAAGTIDVNRAQRRHEIVRVPEIRRHYTFCLPG